MKSRMTRFIMQTGGIIVLTGMLGLSCAPATPDADAQPPADLFGDELVKADGSRVEAASATDKDILGIYFSAHWCPPCRAFTPTLVETANTLTADGKSFGVIFVSSDRSEKDMLTYMQEYAMPWVAVPHGSQATQALSQRYGVRGIPTLVVIDRDGNTLSTNGRGDIASRGAAAFDAWVDRSPTLE